MKCMNCGKERMIYRSKHRVPGWAIFCAIFFFPLGLLFLLVRKKVNYFFCDECGYEFEQ